MREGVQSPGPVPGSVNRAGSHPIYTDSRPLHPDLHVASPQWRAGEDPHSGDWGSWGLTWEDEDEEGADAADDADDLAEVRQEQGHGKRHGDPEHGQRHPDPWPRRLGQGLWPTSPTTAPPPEVLHHRPGGHK